MTRPRAATQPRPARPAPSWELVAETSGIVVGIDEVGRGAWAGPVVAAAVVLSHGLTIPGLADSKLLTAQRRRALDRHIRSLATAVGLGWVAAAEVDAHGLTWAVRQSGLRALADLAGDPPAEPPVRIILDGNHNYLRDTHPSIAIIKADALIVPVAAASVVAKVARDRYMQILARLHAGYGFESHVGYGTAAHQAALRQLGPSPQHRRLFQPIQGIIHVAT